MAFTDTRAEKIATVVVTFNRKALLRECLEALQAQTRPIDEIMVIDNASTDGTEYMVTTYFPNITYIRLQENFGGAGGFYEGIKRVSEAGFEWIWTMDDDTIPDRDALQQLIQNPFSHDPNTGFLCSHVVWIDGEPHHMNIPGITRFLSNKNGILPSTKPLQDGALLVAACSFVSLLIRKEAIYTVGLPIKEFFIWLDDVEFTQRISNQFLGYYLLKSRVVHKTKKNYCGKLDDIFREKIHLRYYLVRNSLFIAKKTGYINFIISALIYIKETLNLRKYGFGPFIYTIKGITAATFFNPSINFPKYKPE